MQRELTRKVLKHTFWLSILLHLLFLATLSIVIVFEPEEKKAPHYYVPSYVYKGAITPTPTMAAPSTKNTPPKQKMQQTRRQTRTQKPVDTSQHGILPPSMLATSLTTLQQNQFKDIAKPKESEPVLLIGDQNEVADPLIKLMGRSLSANFRYPETEGRLGIKGRVILELTLHPQGHISDIHLVKSSENKNLDAAALYAANTAPLIEGADRFLDHPKRFVIGFVFY
jgi:TonB family protein